MHFVPIRETIAVPFSAI